MNHKRNSLLSGSYVPFTKVPEPWNECALTISSALFRDGCLRNTIVKRERAGTFCHHSAPRPLLGCCQRGEALSDRAWAAWYSNRSSPAIHRISSLAVLTTCVLSPVTGFTFMAKAVRVDEWKGAALAGDLGISSVLLCRDSAMTEVSFFWPEEAPLLTHNVYGALDEALL